MNELFNIIFQLEKEQDTAELAAMIAESIKMHSLSKNFILYLCGDLGTGKTTFSRYLLQSLGHVGKVKSPTYTLMEHYVVNDQQIYHLDLYRLNDQDELNFLGLEDYLALNNGLFLIEWPDKANHFLPTADLMLNFSHTNTNRSVELTLDTNNHVNMFLWKKLEHKLSDGL